MVGGSGSSDGAIGEVPAGESEERDGGGDGVTQGGSSMLSIPSGEMPKIGRREGRLVLKREVRVDKRRFRTAVASGSGSGSGAILIVKI